MDASLPGRLVQPISSQEHVHNLHTGRIIQYRDLKERVDEYSKWSISGRAVKLLELAGIPVTDTPDQGSSHPANKTIEEYINHVLLPLHIPKNEPRITAIWLKESKARHLATKLNTEIVLQNIKLDGKDNLRYTTDDPNFSPIETRYCTMHEGGHFLTPLDIYEIFSRSPNMHHMLLTIVVPAELLDDMKPLIPEIYKFTVHDDNTFSYFPDGHGSSAYNQPISGIWWLKTNEIVGKDSSLKVHKLESMFAHHIFLVTRSDGIPSNYNHFNFPGRVKIPEFIANTLTGNYKKTSIDDKLLQTTLGYIANVAKAAPHQVRYRATAAKMSCEHFVPPSDLTMAVELANALMQVDLAGTPDPLIVYKFHHLLTRRGVILYIRRMINAPHQLAWRMMSRSMELDPYTAEQKLEPVFLNKWSPYSVALTRTLPPMKLKDFTNLIGSLIIGEHTSSPLGMGTFNPFFSQYLVDTVIPTLGLYELYKRIDPDMMYTAATTTVSCFKWAINNPRTAAIILPWLGVAAPIAALTLQVATLSIRNQTIKMLHDINYHAILPSKVANVYDNVKLAAAPRTLFPARCSTNHLVVHPRNISVRSPLSALRVPTNLNPVLELDSSESSESTTGVVPEALSTEGLSVLGVGTAEDLTETEALPRETKLNKGKEKAPRPVIFVPPMGNFKCAIKNLGINTRTDPTLNKYKCTMPISRHEGEFVCALDDIYNTTINCPKCLTFKDSNIVVSYPKKNTCFFDALSSATNISAQALWHVYQSSNPRAKVLSEQCAGIELGDIALVAWRTDLNITVVDETRNGFEHRMGDPAAPGYIINYRVGHYYHTASKLHIYDNSPGEITNNIPWKDYEPNYQVADEFLNNIKNGKFGRVLPRETEWILRCTSFIKAPLRKIHKICGIMGIPGSCKTYPILKVLAKFSDDKKADQFRVIYPTVDLMKDGKEKLKIKPGHGFKTPTLETPFISPVTPFVMIDELGKFPPGYIDLLLICQPTIKHVIFTGDPAQNVYYCPKSDNTLNRMTPEIERFSPYSACYLTTTTRLSNRVANRLGIPHTYNDRPGDIIVTRSSVLVGPTLVGSDLNVRKYEPFNLEGVHTMGSSQGLTFNKTYTILADGDTAAADNRAWYTALTRGTMGIRVVVTPNANGREPHHNSSIARALIREDSAILTEEVTKHIKMHTPRHLADVTKVNSTNPFSGKIKSGNNPLGMFTEVNSETLPHLQMFLDETPAPHYVRPSCEIEYNSFCPKLKQPTLVSLIDKRLHKLDQQGKLLAIVRLIGSIIDQPRLPEDREKLVNGIMTEQVEEKTELHMCFLRHKRGDRATEDWTNKGRWKPGPGEDLRKTAATGHLLKTAFDQTYDPKYPAFDPILFDECTREDQQKFLDKGFKALFNIRERASPDWEDCFAETFMKGQSITKPGTFDRDAKMGQLVISFNTSMNFFFGGLARYITKQMKTALPDNFFWLDGKTDADLSAFVLRLWNFTRESSEDDYSFFDVTQGGEFINFDVQLMRSLNIPEFYINKYVAFMTGLFTWMGKMGYMMPSGCKFTLSFNTFRSAAYQALKYIIKPKTPMCLTGDDVACNDKPAIRPTWKYHEARFKLISKRQSTFYPTFCGWILTPAGCIKNPTLLLERTLYQLGRNNLNKCFFSYAADSTPLHQNIEFCTPYLTEKQIVDHFSTRDLLTAEATSNGVKLNGSFQTTYGLTRHYDVTQ